MRVVVAEDGLLAREGLLALLATYTEIEVVGVATTLDELLAAADELGPDVVVTDIRMPPTSTDEGVRAAKLLRETSPPVGVVVLSQFAELEFALALLFEAGPHGRAYLLKERLSRPDEVAEAIREVASGGSCLDPRIVELLVSRSTPQPASPLESLSVREREVLELMATGRSNNGIAEALGLSPSSVEKHINSLFAKLGLPPEPDLARTTACILGIGALVTATSACGDDDKASSAAPPARYCEVLADLDAIGEEAFGALPDDATEEQYDAVQQSFVEDNREKFEALIDAAPASIQDDVRTVVEGAVSNGAEDKAASERVTKFDESCRDAG